VVPDTIRILGIALRAVLATIQMRGLHSAPHAVLAAILTTQPLLVAKSALLASSLSILHPPAAPNVHLVNTLQLLDQQFVMYALLGHMRLLRVPIAICVSLGSRSLGPVAPQAMLAYPVLQAHMQKSMDLPAAWSALQGSHQQISARAA
jgi:hypothetical protein